MPLFPQAQLTPPTTHTIFVGGICGNHTEQTIYNYFSRFCSVTKVQMKKKFLKSKGREINCGFCTIDIASKSDYQAVLRFQNHRIQGRKVSCRPFLRGKALTASKSSKDQKKLFICNLHKNTTNGDLTKAFGAYGSLDSAYTISDQKTGNSKGFGFVTFLEESDFQTVLKLSNKLELKGRRIKICKFEDNKKNEEPKKYEKSKSQNRQFSINNKNSKTQYFTEKSSQLPSKSPEIGSSAQSILPKDTHNENELLFKQFQETYKKLFGEAMLKPFPSTKAVIKPQHHKALVESMRNWFGGQGSEKSRTQYPNKQNGAYNKISPSSREEYQKELEYHHSRPMNPLYWHSSLNDFVKMNTLIKKKLNNSNLNFRMNRAKANTDSGASEDQAVSTYWNGQQREELRTEPPFNMGAFSCSGKKDWEIKHWANRRTLREFGPSKQA